MDQEVRILLC